MGRIRVLSDNIANKIAAGEVVERPSSVVKELLENSLDAGATDLRIETEAGGRRLIRIADNGCGMLRDDALLAFERHATSKLAVIEDLDAIATLGFRGEALPSIAAVSRLRLETRSAEEPAGAAIEIAGGRMISCEECALAPGTSIGVRDLFFNVPARKKFLRSEQTELAHIASLVTHYSLAHPEKSFELTHSGKELLRVTPAATLRERVYQVFGAAILEELIDLGERRRENFALRGFISRPQVQKLNRNSLYLFVNRRLIRDRLLLHAISAAYYNLIPPATYPFALLFIECDPGEVDVNVHPAKTEVRFHRATVVHDFVRDSLRESLVETKPVPALPPPVSPVQAAPRLPYSEFSQQIENMRFDEVRVAPEAPGEVLPDFALRPARGPDPRLDFGGASIPVTPPPAAPAQPAPPLRLPVPDTHTGFPVHLTAEAGYTMADLTDLRVLGQIHESFIVAAGRDGLWIIDQHVAHERILFEKVVREMAAGRVEQQRLLMPVVLEITPAQQVEYDRIAQDLDAAGFETEPFGHRTIAVKAAPAGLAMGDLDRVVHEILDIAEAELRKVSAGDLRRGLAATIACRAAIKINTRLDDKKMDWLLRELARTEMPMSCPHGRPVALRYSTREILRSFHRI